MMMDWFNAREAANAGMVLADQFAPGATILAAKRGQGASKEKSTVLEDLFARADRQVRALRLNFYKKARLANSFKWRLIEKGVDPDLADEVTQSLVLHLSHDPGAAAASPESSPAPSAAPLPQQTKALFSDGIKQLARGEYAAAADCFQKLIDIDANQPEALNNLGAALCNLGRYVEAEQRFRQAIDIKPEYADALCNLGNVLRWLGGMTESETALRRALKLKPNYLDARASLGLTLLFLGDLRDAKARFAKVLKASPRHADALFGTGQIARLEGRFGEAETAFKKLLQIKPQAANAWSTLVSLRKMTAADAKWLEGAKALLAGGLSPLDEVDLRFAIGKYCDDVEDFQQAFENYRQGNDLLKLIAERYDRQAYTRFVDDLIRSHTRAALQAVGAGGSDSKRPTFVVGMPRSGTSLTEQIIASHPSARGAGELNFWAAAVGANESAVRQGLLGQTTRNRLAEEYLKVLASHSKDALRVVDKTPMNSDYLGIIHSVFPNARFIYMQRDPIDTCLSCYFQQFPPGLNFTLDLSDLAHYYLEHQRLMNHWRGVLPADRLLVVPYADLVNDQEAWTRKILDFLGLEWDARCLAFHETKRAVSTASAWQVRQKLYSRSIGRWRDYEKFMGPLKGLRN